jgi:two-component system phosphate regulon sensor histidine kinase PhoR
MKSQHIRLIIFLASIALIGVLINQVFWIRKEISIQKNKLEEQKTSLHLKKEQFENVVTIALVNVRDELLSLNKELSGLYLEPVKQITPNYFVVSFYDTINPNLLENLLVEKFEQYNILEKFEYGIYDCFADSMIFDRYVDLSDNRLERGVVSTVQNKKWNHDGHYFGVYFSEKKDILPSPHQEISTSLIISTIVILIVFFILTYAILVILQQKRLSEVKTDFINNMTHELKTPISTIGLSSEVLLKEDILKDPKRIKQYAKIIKTENNRLQSQVEKVLHLAKLDKGNMELKKEPINLHKLIEESIQVFDLTINKRNGIINKNLLANESKIFLDKDHITNVIYNLLDNANKYSPESPIIDISSRNIKNGIEISVKDKGIGLSPNQNKLVFDKFYRVPTGSIHNVKGFGLGLYYVKFIINKHAGNIIVNSKLNQGCEFVFWLPFK